MHGLVVPLVLGFFAAERAADLGLAALESWHGRRAGPVPPELEGLLDEHVAARARAYARARSRLDLLRGLVGAALTLGLLRTGALPWFDQALDALGLSRADEFVLFLVALALLLAATDLPFAAWRVFVIEPRFRGRRVGLPGFALERGRAVALVLVLGVPFL
jgi:CAAX prenyl protease N-terminal, five membrane helices